MTGSLPVPPVPLSVLWIIFFSPGLSSSFFFALIMSPRGGELALLTPQRRGSLVRRFDFVCRFPSTVGHFSQIYSIMCSICGYLVSSSPSLFSFN